MAERTSKKTAGAGRRAKVEAANGKPAPAAERFRRLALRMKDSAEGAHMGHPDFRVGGKIFATIHADHLHGMVKLTAEQQERFVRESPAAFAPESGAWGRAGCTRVTLDAVDEETLGEALTLARQNAAKPPPARRTKTTTPGAPSRTRRKD